MANSHPQPTTAATQNLPRQQVARLAPPLPGERPAFRHVPQVAAVIGLPWWLAAVMEVITASIAGGSPSHVIPAPSGGGPASYLFPLARSQWRVRTLEAGAEQRSALQAHPRRRGGVGWSVQGGRCARKRKPEGATSSYRSRGHRQVLAHGVQPDMHATATRRLAVSGPSSCDHLAKSAGSGCVFLPAGATAAAPAACRG